MLTALSIWLMPAGIPGAEGVSNPSWLGLLAAYDGVLASAPSLSSCDLPSATFDAAIDYIVDVGEPCWLYRDNTAFGFLLS